jgi:hypothetical protein
VFVCCECCVLSGRGLCDELITRPEESYRLRCIVCDLHTSRMRAPWSNERLSCPPPPPQKKQTNKQTNKLVTLLGLITRQRYGETVFKKILK